MALGLTGPHAEGLAPDPRARGLEGSALAHPGRGASSLPAGEWATG
jgi:hypothetical protein